MTQKNSKLSRRDFLKKIGVGTAALITAEALISQAERANASSGASSDDAWGILIDLTRCVGCNSCALACKEINCLPHEDELPGELSSEAYTFVDTCEVTCNGEAETCYVKRQCMHCLEPACASACTVGALRKTPEGPVVYDADKCIGCRYCQYACPFGVPTYDWDNVLGLIHKCQMCVERLDNSQQPACVSACPNGALRFSKREKLLAEAHARIASNPNRYVDHVFGEYEVGGTSILYLSSVPFTELEFPELQSEPIPRYAEMVMKGTPITAVSVASIATALHLILKRRGGGHAAETIEVEETEGSNDS